MTKGDKIDRILDDLQYELLQGVPIIVEGINDKKALSRLGLHGEIMTLSKTTLSELTQALSQKGVKKAIILTDLDPFGNKAAEKLKNFFLNEAIQPDLSYREKLNKLVGVVQFEDLPKIIEEIREE